MNQMLKAQSETMKSLLASKNLMFVMVCALVAGCAQSKTVPVATEPDLVSLRIAQAAEKASSALDTISGIEQYAAPYLPESIDYSQAPPELQELITVKWTGPIDQMLSALATRAGMRFNSIGYKGLPSPLIVTVDVYQKPLIEVLHDVGLQAGRRAEVSVDTANSLIEIRYTPADRM